MHERAIYKWYKDFRIFMDQLKLIIEIEEQVQGNKAVSYTHLDVYKRQVGANLGNSFLTSVSSASVL